MEFINSLSDGRKAVVYDEGNNITIIFITNVRNMQSAVVARDYLSALDCLYFRNNLYVVYISNTNEVKWKQVGREESLILITGTNEVWDVSNLKMFVINEKIYVSYQIYNDGKNAYEIRYINPNGDRKTKLMLSEKERILKYDITEINEEIYLKIKVSEETPYEYFRLSIDGQEDIGLSREYLIDEEEENRRQEKYENKIKSLEAEKAEIKKELEKQYEDEKEKNDEKLKVKLESLKEELSRQHTEEIKALEENYTRQYNELSDMTRQIQEEGKKYRELYVQALNVINEKHNKEISEKQSANNTAKKTEKQSSKNNKKAEKSSEEISEKKAVGKTEKRSTGNPGNKTVKDLISHIDEMAEKENVKEEDVTQEKITEKTAEKVTKKTAPKTTPKTKTGTRKKSSTEIVENISAETSN